jgi:hypothetical protein
MIVLRHLAPVVAWVVIAATPVLAQDARSWVGREVFFKYNNTEHLVTTSRVIDHDLVRVYTVTGTEGNRLRVRSGSVVGWIPVKDVVLCKGAIDFCTREIASDPSNTAALIWRGVL